MGVQQKPWDTQLTTARTGPWLVLLSSDVPRLRWINLAKFKGKKVNKQMHFIRGLQSHQGAKNLQLTVSERNKRNRLLVMFYCRLLHHPWQENTHSHSAQIKCKKPSHTFLSFISKHPIVSCLMSKRGTPTTETNLMYRLFCSSYSSLGNLSLPIIIITMQILLACLFNWKQPFGC